MRDFLVSFMGPLFGLLFDFYEAHAVVFNTVVVAYGFVIILSWTNLVNIRRQLVAAIISQVQHAPEKYAEAKSQQAMKDIKIPWEDAVSAARFPLVARQVALYPRRKSVETVQELLPAEALVKEALEVVGTVRKQEKEAKN